MYNIKGEHNLSPPNMPLWHEDYFELKAMKFQQIQGKLFTSPQPLIFILDRGLYQEKSYNQRYLSNLRNFHNRAVFEFQALPLHSCEPPSLPLYPQNPTPFLSSGCYLNLNYLSALWVLYFHGALRHTNIHFSLVNLSMSV